MSEPEPQDEQTIDNAKQEALKKRWEEAKAKRKVLYEEWDNHKRIEAAHRLEKLEKASRQKDAALEAYKNAVEKATNLRCDYGNAKLRVKDRRKELAKALTKFEILQSNNDHHNELNSLFN